MEVQHINDMNKVLQETKLCYRHCFASLASLRQGTSLLGKWLIPNKLVMLKKLQGSVFFFIIIMIFYFYFLFYKITLLGVLLDI